MCAAWERASLRGMSVVVGKHSRWGPQHEHAEMTAGACDEVEKAAEARRDGVVKFTLSRVRLLPERVRQSGPRSP